MKHHGILLFYVFLNIVFLISTPRHKLMAQEFSLTHLESILKGQNFLETAKTFYCMVQK